MTDVVLLEREGPVARITLNRPDAMNAINDALREALPRRVREADADPDIRVIVIRGAGQRAFCAGADIKEFTAIDAPVAYRQARVHDSWIRAFDESRKPIVAAIHGYCLGGGLEIALACDIRIAARNATFAFPETGLGIITGVGGSQRAVRILGLGLALDMMLTGERIDATRAHAIGLISRLSDDDAIDDDARALAQTIASKAPLATVLAKEAVKAAAETEFRMGMRLETDLLTHLINSEDRLEAARAFKEKRLPRFVGK
jgi:enoyl-CoA hydratase/carnithine racemase